MGADAGLNQTPIQQNQLANNNMGCGLVRMWCRWNVTGTKLVPMVLLCYVGPGTLVRLYGWSLDQKCICHLSPKKWVLMQA